MRNDRKPKSLDLVRLAQNLFFTNAVIWLVLLTISMIRFSNGNTDFTLVFGVIVLLMAGNITVLFAIGKILGRRQKRFYYFAVFVLVINIILSITDEFGIFDFVILLFNLILLGILVLSRQSYSNC